LIGDGEIEDEKNELFPEHFAFDFADNSLFLN